MNRVGIVTGLTSEADCLRAIAGTEAVTIRCAGASPSRARMLAGELAAAGGVALASFGVAGGLRPDLRPGDVILADGVAGEGGLFAADAAWLGRARALLDRQTRLTVGRLAGAGATVATAGAKSAMREQTGAVAVDMESAAVAAVARQFGLPFLAVRVIADTAAQRIPPWLAGVIDEAGAVRVGTFCGGLLKRPQDAMDVWRLAAANRRAMAALRRVAALLGPRLGFL